MEAFKKKILTNCVLTMLVCFIAGFTTARLNTDSTVTDMTIISQIAYLKQELEKKNNLKDFLGKQISYRDKWFQEETDENKKLEIYAERKSCEKSIEKVEKEISALTAKIEKKYEKLRKRHPEYKGDDND